MPLPGIKVVDLEGGYVRFSWAGSADKKEVLGELAERGITPSMSPEVHKDFVDGAPLVAIGDELKNPSKDPDFKGLRSHLGMCSNGNTFHLALEQRIGEKIHVDEGLDRVHVLGKRA